jgi:hypothetical protein
MTALCLLDAVLPITIAAFAVIPLAELPVVHGYAYMQRSKCVCAVERTAQQLPCAALEV